MKKFSESFLSILSEINRQKELEEFAKKVIIEYEQAGIETGEKEIYCGKVLCDVKLTATYGGSNYCYKGKLYITSKEVPVPVYESDYYVSDLKEGLFQGLRKYFISEGYTDKSISYTEDDDDYARLFFSKMDKGFYISVCFYDLKI